MDAFKIDIFNVASELAGQAQRFKKNWELEVLEIPPEITESDSEKDGEEKFYVSWAGLLVRYGFCQYVLSQ